MATAFVFPGQGSQKVGMGQELYDNYPVAKEVMDQADAAVDFDLKKLCFEGPMEELSLSHHVQPAITAVNLMALAVLTEKGISADYIAGHSLGEYSAIAAAGVVSTADAVKLAALRGKYMQECADQNPGAMAAILGLSPEAIEAELAKVPADKGIVQVANFNSTAQSVISGNTDAVAVASGLLSEAGARRIVPLPVSGPWHSPLVAGALDKLGPVLDETTFNAPTATLIQNVPGAPVADAAEIRENLKKQVTGSVQWVKTMQYLLDNGVDTVTEVGPGAVLQGLAKAADRKWTKQSYTACL